MERPAAALTGCGEYFWKGVGKPMHRFFTGLSRFFANLGGTVLTVLVLMVCLSVLGRSLNSMLHGDLLQSFVPVFANTLLATGIGPINGDFELVEAGMAFAVFAFLPLCHIERGHASVDIFTALMPAKADRLLRMVIEIVFATILIVIAYQLFLGALSKQSSGQTTFLLQFPLWWAYAASVVAAVVAAIVAVYTAIALTLEFATGRPFLPDGLGADH